MGAPPGADLTLSPCSEESEGFTYMGGCGVSGHIVPGCDWGLSPAHNMLRMDVPDCAGISWFSRLNV